MGVRPGEDGEEKMGVRPVSGTTQLFLQTFGGPLQLSSAMFSRAAIAAWHDAVLDENLMKTVCSAPYVNETRCS